MKKSKVFLFGDGNIIFFMTICGLIMLGGIVCLCVQIVLKNIGWIILGLIYFIVGASVISVYFFGHMGEYILKEGDEITIYRLSGKRVKSFLLNELYEIRIRSLAASKFFGGKYICLYFSEASMLKSGIEEDLFEIRKIDGVLPIIYAKQHIMWLRAMLGEEVWKEKYKGT